MDDERITNLKNKIANLPPENQSVILEILKKNKSSTKSEDKDSRSIFDVEEDKSESPIISDSKIIKTVNVNEK